MAKCGGCGQFMARAECVRCTKCPGSYHPTCIGITSTKVSPNWLCPDCKAKIPRKDNSATPVKGPSEGVLINSQSITIQASSKTQSPALNQSAVVEQTSVKPVINQLIQPPSPITTGSRDLDVAYEIRCFREELSAMRVELRQFRDEMASLKADVGLCRERMSVIEDKVFHLEKRFEEKETSPADHLEDTIAELKLQLNERDQDLLLNDVIITGIPETKDESPLHLVHLVSLKLGISIDEREIVNAERIGMVRRNFTVTGGSADAAERARPRALAVRLSRRVARDQLLRAARVRRGLTTADLDLRGPARRFYLNERLTPINGKLFFNAREAGQRHNFKYVWTKDGRIYVKKEDGVPPQRIRSDLDMVRIFGNASV